MEYLSRLRLGSGRFEQTDWGEAAPHDHCDVLHVAGRGGVGCGQHVIPTRESAVHGEGPHHRRPRRHVPQLQALLARVEIRPDENFTARYPQDLNARVTVRTKDQRVFVKEQLGYEGGLANPLSWDRTVEKFHWLSEAFADADLRHALVRTVQQLDARPLSELTDLLARVRPAAAFPTAHRGIQ
jgi:hypothetical protein